MERAIIRAKSRYSPESMVGTGNCTLPYFCDSRQGEKKVSLVSFGRVGRVTGNKNFFFFGLMPEATGLLVLRLWKQGLFSIQNWVRCPAPTFSQLAEKIPK